MADFISRLLDSALPTEDFQEVMKFLFGFISKERQFESLVQKLCERFVTVDSVS